MKTRHYIAGVFISIGIAVTNLLWFDGRNPYIAGEDIAYLQAELNYKSFTAYTASNTLSPYRLHAQVSTLLTAIETEMMTSDYGDEGIWLHGAEPAIGHPWFTNVGSQQWYPYIHALSDLSNSVAYGYIAGTNSDGSQTIASEFDLDGSAAQGKYLGYNGTNSYWEYHGLPLSTNGAIKREFPPIFLTNHLDSMKLMLDSMTNKLFYYNKGVIRDFTINPHTGNTGVVDTAPYYRVGVIWTNDIIAISQTSKNSMTNRLILRQGGVDNTQWTNTTPCPSGQVNVYMQSNRVANVRAYADFAPFHFDTSTYYDLEVPKLGVYGNPISDIGQDPNGARDTIMFPTFQHPQNLTGPGWSYEAGPIVVENILITNAALLQEFDLGFQAINNEATYNPVQLFNVDNPTSSEIIFYGTNFWTEPTSFTNLIPTSRQTWRHYLSSNSVSFTVDTYTYHIDHTIRVNRSPTVYQPNLAVIVTLKPSGHEPEEYTPDWLLPDFACWGYSAYGTGIKIDSYTCSNAFVTIPNTLNGDKAVYLDGGCFGSPNTALYLQSITLGRYIDTIGSLAFANCTNLLSAHLENVVLIGPSAFANASRLSSIVIPDTTTFIGENAFKDCTNATSLTLGSSVLTIDNSAFQNCRKLANFTIPDSVTIIGQSAFQDCRSITEITIPGTVTSIGASAFTICTSLVSVVVENGVTNLPAFAFSRGFQLQTVTIPESFTTMGSGAFDDCPRLTRVNFYCNAPGGSVPYNDSDLFGPGTENVTNYVKNAAATNGWGATYGGRPVVFEF